MNVTNLNLVRLQEQLRVCDGWIGITDRLAEDIVRLLGADVIHFNVSRAKEKIGQLRVYYSLSTENEKKREMIDDLFAVAVLESTLTCYFCGDQETANKRSRHGSGYILPQCDRCASTKFDDEYFEEEELEGDKKWGEYKVGISSSSRMTAEEIEAKKIRSLVSGLRHYDGWLIMAYQVMDKVGAMVTDDQRKRVRFSHYEEGIGRMRINYVAMISDPVIKERIHAVVSECIVMSSKTCAYCGETDGTKIVSFISTDHFRLKREHHLPMCQRCIEVKKIVLKQS